MLRVGAGGLKARKSRLEAKGWDGWGPTAELGHRSSQLLKMMLQVPVALLEVRDGVQV